MKIQSQIHLNRFSESNAVGSLEPSKHSWSELTHKLQQVVNATVDSKSSSQPPREPLAEMFKLQLEMNKLHMRVELCSKVAESASASIKKLQQAQ